MQNVNADLVQMWNKAENTLHACYTLDTGRTLPESKRRPVHCDPRPDGATRGRRVVAAYIESLAHTNKDY